MALSDIIIDNIIRVHSLIGAWISQTASGVKQKSAPAGGDQAESGLSN